MFNSGSLEALRLVLRKTLEGYINETERYMAYSRLPVVDVDAQNGVFPRTITAESIGTDQNSSVKAKGAPFLQISTSMGSVQYQTLDYGVEEVIDNHDLEELTQRQLLDAARMFKRCANKSLLDLDLLLANIIKGNGTGNKAVNTLQLQAGEEFNNFDSTSSDPDGVIQAMVEATLGGDTILMGRNVANALKRHPGIGNKFYAPGARADRSLTDAALVSWLQDTHNIVNVGIDGVFYQQGSEQFALNAARPMAGAFYLGHYENLQLASFKRLYSKAWDSEDTNSRKIAAIHASDIVVQDPALGLALTNVLE